MDTTPTTSRSSLIQERTKSFRTSTTSIIQHKSSYIFRIVNHAYQYANNFDSSMKNLMNTLFGCELEEDKLEEMQLPIGEGGLSLETTVATFAQVQYNSSIALTYGITRNILFNEDHPTNESLNQLRKQISDNKRAINKVSVV